MIYPRRDSNSGCSDLWSNALPTRPWRRRLCVCVCESKWCVCVCVFVSVHNCVYELQYSACPAIFAVMARAQMLTDEFGNIWKYAKPPRMNTDYYVALFSRFASMEPVSEWVSEAYRHKRLFCVISFKRSDWRWYAFGDFICWRGGFFNLLIFKLGCFFVEFVFLGECL